MNKYKKSVAVILAAYNGSKYIKEQIESILLELKVDDFLYVADDCSQDSTIKILENFSDSRLKIIKNKKNIGYIANFDSLIKKVDADYIFFSDQDDVWVSGRIDAMINAAVQSGKNIVFGEFSMIDNVTRESTIFDAIDYNESYLLNVFRLFLGRNEFTYFGSTLMITRKAKNYLFPLMNFDVSHDVWIALLGNVKKDIFHLREIVTMRRIHDSNLTKLNRRIFEKILTRLAWLKVLCMYAIR